MKIVGIDEVGRGPLAGPVTVCAVSCDEKIYKSLFKNKNLPALGRDSKKLSKNDREKFEKYLKELAEQGKIKFKISNVSNKIIDSKGISFSINKAIGECVESLVIESEDRVLLDGGLNLPVNFKNQKTIIKGDEKERIIAWASILAKVSRDEFMERVGKKYKSYGFEVHKGYGTLSHRSMIKKNGLSPIHRKTFCRNIIW